MFIKIMMKTLSSIIILMYLLIFFSEEGAELGLPEWTIISCLLLSFIICWFNEKIAGWLYIFTSVIIFLSIFMKGPIYASLIPVLPILSIGVMFLFYDNKNKIISHK